MPHTNQMLFLCATLLLRLLIERRRDDRNRRARMSRLAARSRREQRRLLGLTSIKPKVISKTSKQTVSRLRLKCSEAVKHSLVDDIKIEENELPPEIKEEYFEDSYQCTEIHNTKPNKNVFNVKGERCDVGENIGLKVSTSACESKLSIKKEPMGIGQYLSDALNSSEVKEHLHIKPEPL